MRLLFRLIYTFVVGRFRPKCPPMGPCKTPFLVWPTDLDVLLHMNNGRYLTLMDLARVDLTLRSGLYAALKDRAWYPVVTAESIQFFKPLTLFQTFEIETRVIGWDDRAFLLQQRFLRQEEVIAEAVIRARYLKRTGGTVPPEDVLSEISYAGPTPTIPPWVKRWSNDQQARRQHSKTAPPSS